MKGFSRQWFPISENIAFCKISRLLPFVLRVKQSVGKNEYGVLVE
jgi:hypothetical protein